MKYPGAILEEVPKDGDGLRIKGSVMLALAESREEVIRTLQEDVYYKAGIWDWDQVQIYPVSGIGRWSPQSSSTNQGSSNLRSGNLFNVPMVSGGLSNPC